MYLEVLDVIKQELTSTYKEDVPDILPTIYTANRIFIAGAGRSKLIASMFAMRLMHCGYNVHIVGDVTTPSLNSDDILLVVSSSGKTSQLVSFAEKAREVNAKVILITANKKSILGLLSDQTVQIGGDPRQINNVLPLGGRFELSALVFLESLIIQIMQENDLIDEDLAEVHANLE